MHRYLLALLATILVGATFSYFAITGGAKSSAISPIFPDNEDWVGSNFFGLMIYLYQALLLGTFENDDLDDTNYSILGKLIFIALSLFVLIICLNLLIALMSDSFERIKEREEQEFTFQTAKLIVGIEVRYALYSGTSEELKQRFPACT